MSNIKFKFQTITPAMAQKMLDRTAAAGFENRSLSKSNVRRYANDIQNGNWKDCTAECIKLTDDGIVVDGNHRLHGVIMANMPAPFWVATGVSLEAFQYLDQGKPRTLSDIMKISGWRDPNALAVTGKMLWRNDNKPGEPFCHAGSFNECDGAVFEWVSSLHPELQSFWDAHKTEVLNAKRYSKITESLLLYVYYIWSIESAEDAQAVFKYLNSKGQDAAMNVDGPVWVQNSVGRAVELCKELNVEWEKSSAEGVTKSAMRHADKKETFLAVLEWGWSQRRNTRKNMAAFRKACKLHLKQKFGKAAALEAVAA